MAPTWKSKVEGLKRKYVKKVFTMVGLLSISEGCSETPKNDEEIHKLVMVAVAQHDFVDLFIYEGNKRRNLVQSQISRVLENL